MKTLGMATLMNAGFNLRRALVLLGYTVGQGRGSSTALVTKAAAPVPAVAPRNGPLRRIGAKRAPLTPAEAAANLRRRITGKRPGI